MPKVTAVGKTYLLKWPAELDERILFVSERYIKTWRGRVVVDWETANECLEFEDFPNVDLKLISKRFYTLKLQRDNPKLYKEKLKNKKAKGKLRNRKSEKNQQADSRKRIHDLWDTLPLKDKLRHGYNPRKVWSKIQKKALFNLVEKYRHENGRINWNAVIKDKKALSFPEKYQTDFNKLRYYYWSIVSGEKLYEKKKLCNQRYVEKNRKKCRGYLKNREKMIRESVVEFLLKKL